jgi:hypothetical protein
MEAAEFQSAEARLAALEGIGARSYDAPACDCVRTLLDRADELGGAVGARLRERALSHLESLSERFARDRQRVEQRLSETEALRGALPELRTRLERGELTSTARAIRRWQARPRAMRSVVVTVTEGLRGGKHLSNGIVTDRRRRALAYEDSVAQLVASLALARATDVVPADAGPYNPLRIASDVLDRMREVSPFYLAVQLNRLEELSSLLSLPELPPPPERKKVLPKRKPGTPKR